MYRGVSTTHNEHSKQVQIPNPPCVKPHAGICERSNSYINSEKVVQSDEKNLLPLET